MAKKETAEQKLLKLIENEEKKDGGKSETPVPVAESTPKSVSQPGPDVAQQVARSVQSSGLPAISIPAFAEPVLNLIRGMTGTKRGEPLGIRQVNVVLMFVAFFLSLFLVWNIVQGMNISSQGLNIRIETSAAASRLAALPAFTKVSEYLEQFKERNIFFPYEKQAVQEATVVPAGQQMINQRIENFRLVGISWLDSPSTATAMIEDEKTSITHFLRQGDELNGVRIKVIYADRVVLDYRNEEAVLKL